MGIKYGDKHETLQPSSLSDADLLSIGRLIRAFAGIEEIVSIYLSTLARVPPKAFVLLLGKVALRRRLDMAEALATLDSEEELSRFKTAFPPEFNQALDARNAVAHGIFLGVDEQGHLSFLTERTDKQGVGETIQIVHGITPEDLRDLAVKVEQNIDATAAILRLTSSLQKYRQPTLRPHRKAQPRRTPSEKPKRPPPPSQA
jgi:hypothetical protein